MNRPRSVVALLCCALAAALALLGCLLLARPLAARAQNARPLEPPEPPPTLSSTLSITRTLTRAREIPANWVPPTLDSVNGLPLDSFLVLPPDVIDHMREIYQRGQRLGRNARAFAKIGDSTIEYPYFLIPFDNQKYQLGIYADLQQTIDWYAGSFGRRSAALKVGAHSWTVLNPKYVDLSECQKGESPTGCELRLWNPSIALIRLGPNDAGNVKLFAQNFRTLIEYLINQGVIPVLSTKADRQPGMTEINELMRQWAAEYRIPLWDLDRVMEGMPQRGLWIDGVHMSTFAPMDFGDPVAYQRGHAIQNLTALMLLDRLRIILTQ